MPEHKGYEGQYIDTYRLIHRLGEGAFGEVYLAEHLRDHTQVAVKVLKVQLSSKWLKDFEAEVRVLFRLIHPHIVRLRDFSLISEPPFLAMDYAPGGTLRQRHPPGTLVPLPLVCSYIQQVASALQYAHQQGVIHRDVKPRNMLLASDGNTIWLSDFGVTTIAHSEHSLRTQDMAGTVPYMAPEQLQGKPRPASDQYALGIVVYEWLTGTSPFTGSEVEIITQHLYTSPPSLRKKVPTLPPAVDAVVLQALSKEPQERFVDLDAFARALQEASQSAHSHPARLFSTANSPSSPLPSLPAPATPPVPVDVPPVTPPPSHNPGSILMPVPPDNRTPQFPATVVPASNSAIHRSFTQPAILLPIDDTSQSRPIAHVPPTYLLPRHTRSRMTIKLLFAGLALLLIVSGTFLYPMVLNNYFISPNATATSAATATVAAQAYATGTTQQGVMFGLDPAHTHWNRYERVLNVSTLSRLKPLWSYTTGYDIDSPAVAGGMLYIGSHNRKLYAFAATCRQACQPLWSYTTGDSIFSSPAIAGSMLYIGSDDGKLYAFAATCRQACQPLWSYITRNSISSSPAVANGMLYIGSWDGKLYAFDAACRQACQPLWSYTTGSFISSSPAVANGMLYIGSGDGKLYAFAAACRQACQPLWSYTTGNMIGSSPAVAGGMLYISADDGTLYAFDAACRQACQPLWSYTTRYAFFSSPAVAGGMLYVGSSDHKIYAFDAACKQACQPLWSYTTGDIIDSSPAVAGGMLYIGSSDHKIYAFDAACKQACQPLWSYTTGGSISSSPAIANGMLYIGSHDGKLYAFGLTG